MPSFPKPSFAYDYEVNQEIVALKNWRDNEEGRAIPNKHPNHLLIATWNIANLGLHDRRTDDYKILAEIISWFDLIALQEVNDDLSGLRSILELLPNYKAIFSDKAGNDERLAFIYESSKISILEKFGEISIPPKDQKFIKLKGITQKFAGYDRNPFLVSFQSGLFKFILVNVHLYFGSESKAHVNRRALEAYATARWCALRRDDKHAYVSDIIALGDFNLPKLETSDPIYQAISKRGLRRPKHATLVPFPSNIANDKHYDQIMFFPANTAEYTGNMGVFDFDTALFKGLWETKSHAQFRNYVKYYISDHRPMWVEFNTTI